MQSNVPMLWSGAISGALLRWPVPFGDGGMADLSVAGDNYR